MPSTRVNVLASFRRPRQAHARSCSLYSCTLNQHPNALVYSAQNVGCDAATRNSPPRGLSLPVHVHVHRLSTDTDTTCAAGDDTQRRRAPARRVQERNQIMRETCSGASALSGTSSWDREPSPQSVCVHGAEGAIFCGGALVTAAAAGCPRWWWRRACEGGLQGAWLVTCTARAALRQSPVGSRCCARRRAACGATMPGVAGARRRARSTRARRDRHGAGGVVVGCSSPQVRLVRASLAQQQRGRCASTWCGERRRLTSSAGPTSRSTRSCSSGGGVLSAPGPAVGHRSAKARTPPRARMSRRGRARRRPQGARSRATSIS